MRYNNYHKHTHYSNIRTLDCISKPEDYIKRAVELGHDTYFTTEHGFQGNIYEAQTLCEKYGIKPIYGVESYYVDDIEDKTSRTMYHIILIAMTNNARREINRIMSIANNDGYYYKPRIDLNLLLSLPGDEVVVTTACVASRMFKKDNTWLDNFFIPVKNHFGNNFYLEVQAHVDKNQSEYNKKLLKVHEKYNIPLIHANDSHYIYPEDAWKRDYLQKSSGIFMDDEQGWFMDYPDGNTLFHRFQTQKVLTDFLPFHG